jgi:LysM repeat protein
VKLEILALIACCLYGVTAINAQTTPAEKEDARDERMKILRAADQIDIIQANADKIQVEIANLKEQVTKLQETNNQQQQEITALKTTLAKSEEARAKERDVLIAKISDMIANSKPAPTPTKKTPPQDTAPKDKDKDTPATSTTDTPHDNEHGYYYTVEKGQTLSMIATAFTEKGIKVTVDDIRKANNLGPKDVLKVGQKLFIPKK